MRTMMDNANIRKITVGDSKMGMTYQVGSTYGVVEITSIVRDENAYFLFGNIAYLIYAKVLPTGEEGLWKYFERQPVTVECDIKNRQNGIATGTQAN
jgi:hypothetical protein